MAIKDADTVGVLDALELPSLDGLTDEQVRGVVCAWDCNEERLTVETAVDLGERMSPLSGSTSPVRWFPRACHRHVGEAAYLALFGHAPECERCKVDPDCPFAVAVRQLMRRSSR